MKTRFHLQVKGDGNSPNKPLLNPNKPLLNTLGNETSQKVENPLVYGGER